MKQEETKNTKVISAFPGCGKTYCFNKYKDSNVKILDSDSSEFSWVKDENGNNTKERNSEFPNNYIQHIKDSLGKVDIIFVSSHETVRDSLKNNNIEYIIVYPSLDSKEEYINRYISRGNNEGFINFINSNYENFIKDIKNETYPHKIELRGKETIEDLINYGYCHNFIANHLYDSYGCPIDCQMCNHKKTIINL